MKKTPTEEPYHLQQARAHLRLMRETAISLVSDALHDRGWTQKQAAQHLGVSQPRVSDLRRGLTHKFTLDTLIEMLFALDVPVSLTASTGAKWERSTRPRRDVGMAIGHYTRAIERDPQNASLYGWRAEAWMDDQQYEKALADYDRCIELEPGRPGWRSNRVNARRQAGQHEQALADCDEIAHLFPDYPITATRGLVLAVMGRHQEAIAQYNETIAAEPWRPGPYQNRAWSYQELGNTQAALADYRKVQELDPTSHIARQKVEELSTLGGQQSP
ncbi:MAG TPA: tetratricopeptide repeat protein [Candidatus Xenobia bacterium]|jgi:tetratricopeptide (TPR) repeat protein